jgi:hypothetical protein
MTVSWRVRDFTVTQSSSENGPDAGYFAVFVDRTPIKPGQTLDAVASGDSICENDPKCPNTQYLRDHQVYTTTKTMLRVPQIPNGVGTDEIERHTVTIVLLDTDGRRIGESAWQVDVRTRKVGY